MEMIRGSSVPRTGVLVVLLAVFTAFALNFFVYVYFFPFDEGVGSAPFALKALKDFAYALTLCFCLPLLARRSEDRRRWLFVPFGVILLCMSAVHAPQTGITAQVWENVKNVVIFIPLYSLAFAMDYGQKRWLTTIIFRLIVASAAVQAFFSIMFRMMGRSLWLDNLYVGFMGNPNTFGLILNCAVVICLLAIPESQRKLTACGLYLLIALFAFCIINTASGSQYAILWGLLIYSAGLFLWRKKTGIKAIALSALIVGSVSVAQGSRTIDYVIVPISDMLTSLTGGSPIETTIFLKNLASGPNALRPESLSVSNRRKDFLRTVEVVKGGIASTLFGDFQTREYLKMDGQFFVFLANDGILTLLAFGFAALFVYWISLEMTSRSDPQMIALHLILVAFGITLLVSRILQYFPLNYFFFLIAGLLMAAQSDNRIECSDPR